MSSTALKWQIRVKRRLPTLRHQVLLQQGEWIFLRLNSDAVTFYFRAGALGGERNARLRDQDVEAVMRMVGEARMQQHRPRVG